MAVLERSGLEQGGAQGQLQQQRQGFGIRSQQLPAGNQNEGRTVNQNMGQAEADQLTEGMTVNYWLLVPEAGLPKFELRGPVAIVAIKRADVPTCAADAPIASTAQSPKQNLRVKLGAVQAVKLADSPCWVRREFLVSNIHQA